MKEVHDERLRWMNGSNDARRGEKMSFWSIFRRRHYRYNP